LKRNTKGKKERRKNEEEGHKKKWGLREQVVGKRADMKKKKRLRKRVEEDGTEE
jgi:hypothetical protein